MRNHAAGIEAAARRATLAGRVLFGTALVSIGFEPFITGHLPAGLVPLQTLVLPRVVACAFGVLLIVATLAAVIRPRAPLGPLLLISLFALALLCVHVPRLVAARRNATLIAGAFEVVAFIGGALLISLNRTLGRQVLGIAFAVYGIQHFMYPRFLAALVPSWIPARLFWAYAVGTAFFAASLSALTGRQLRLSGTLLGVMYCTWVVILHAPRIAARAGHEPEWTSLLVALAFGGMGLLLAGSVRPIDEAVGAAKARAPEPRVA
jgi:uncharacterized membrane protein